MTPALVFGFYCPHCGQSHLLSSLGVEPILEDTATPIEPTLGMVETALGDDGEVLNTEDLLAVCGFCEGVFTLDLMASVVGHTKPPPKQALFLVPSLDARETQDIELDGGD